MNRFYLFSLLILTSCNPSKKSGAEHFFQQQATNQEVKRLNAEDFKAVIDGKSVSLYTLENKNGLVCEITNYGGKVVSLWLPDKKGDFNDVVLGYSNLNGYLTAQEKYFGALIGRYGNRIAQGKFHLDGKEYSLATNNGINHLHGGDKGFDAVVWEAEQLDTQTLKLTYTSLDMEEGYPGNLTTVVIYKLTDDNELTINYTAITDKPTVINLTHHSFFNLAGAGNGTINDHILQINADAYTPVDATLIPTGSIDKVAGTPMDFTTPIKIGKRLDQDFEQLKYGGGYDHNYVLNKDTTHFLTYAARVIEPQSGRMMEVFTDEPGLQFYGGNFLDGTIEGKEAKSYQYRSAFCLETQHFPDSPNHPHFPSTRLDPNDTYTSTCVYRFSLAR